MSFSHRDRRAHRSVWRLLVGVTAATVALGAIAQYERAVPAIGAAAVAGLAITGGAALLAGERLIADYGNDLRNGRRPDGPDGFVRVEVRSEVGLERPVGLPTHRSPNVRSPSHRPVERTGPVAAGGSRRGVRVGP